MTIDMLPTPSRRAARATVVALGLGLALVATPAQAAPPESWPVADNNSALWNLMVYIGIPVAVFLLVTLLVYLPSMMRQQSSEEAFQERSEWFGGPRKGVQAVTQGADGAGSTGATSDPKSDPGRDPKSGTAKGGAGGQW